MKVAARSAASQSSLRAHRSNSQRARAARERRLI
jgi:hypothetical protein